MNDDSVPFSSAAEKEAIEANNRNKGTESAKEKNGALPLVIVSASCFARGPFGAKLLIPREPGMAISEDL
jgi:hypothetical protein